MPSNDMDRDFAVRTMLGEAANQGDAGLAAVANVILNRAQSGKYGGTNPTDVVLAKKQFEPWQTRPKELLAIPADGPKYQRAAQIYDMVSSGEIPDITSGATHFLNKATVRGRTGGTLPSWAQGEGQDIGAHTFLKPNGAVIRKPTSTAPDLSGFDALDALSGPAEAPAPAQAGRVRVSLPGSPTAPKPAATEPDGFDALDQLASVNDAPKPAVEPGLPQNAVARGLVNGIPIVGPYALTAINAADAKIRALQNGTTTNDEYNKLTAYGKATAKANPISTTVGEIGGGVLGLAPLAATGPGGIALGLAGRLGARVAAGAVSGAGINALDAAVRGEDPARAAAAGFALGGAAPIAGKAIGAAAAPVVNKLTNAAQNTFGGAARANNALLAAMEASGKDTSALRAELQRNPNLSLADLDTGLRESLVGLGQGGAEAPGIRQFVKDRQAAAPGQVQGAFDASMGSAPDPVALRDLMATVAKGNATKGFGDALKGAQPVDLAGLPESSINKIQSAWDRVLAQFPDKTQVRFSQPEQLHLVQQQLRREADTLAKSAVGTERLAAEDIRNVRSQLVDRIDTASGGKFKPAQKQFADDMQVKEAFDNGASALNRVKQGAAGLEDRPETLKREWAAMSAPEQDAFKQGMRSEIDRVMRNTRNPARAGEAVTDPSFNKEKLEIVFGKAEAKRLMSAVEDTRAMAATNNAITGGSDTAQRAAAREGVRVRGETAPAAGVEMPAVVGAVAGPLAGGISLAAKGVNKLVGGAGRRSDVARNKLLANDLTRSGPEGEAVLNRLDQFLSERAAKKGAIAGAISQSAPLNMLIRSGGNRLLPISQ